MPSSCGQRRIGRVRHAWILQANPKLYDVEAALREKPTIYWRIPQYADHVKTGDLALVWQAGKQAGLVGWGGFRSDPQRYDLSRDHDPFAKEGLRDDQNNVHAPLSVWPGGAITKEEVAAVLPAHRIVTGDGIPTGRRRPCGVAAPPELARLRHGSSGRSWV